MPSPGCAHQAVQHCSLGRFTTYILFYGPFLIHHNTASILLTSPAKHTSFSLPSFFFSLYLSIHYPFFRGVMMPISTHEQVHIHRLNSGEDQINGHISLCAGLHQGYFGKVLCWAAVDDSMCLRPSWHAA